MLHGWQIRGDGMEELKGYLIIFTSNISVWLVIFKASKTKIGSDFIKYISTLFIKDIHEKVEAHEERLNGIDKRLERGDYKMDELSRTIVAGNEATQQRIEDVIEILKK